MFRLIQQVFIGLLSFSECMLLKDEPCITRSTLIGLNPVKFIYYPFEIMQWKL